MSNSSLESPMHSLLSAKSHKMQLAINGETYIHFHNILILFDVLPNLLFTTGETMRDYYL